VGERPLLLGVDDGPFDKWKDSSVVIAGVVVEGCDRVEGVALTNFPVDGAGVTNFLARWIDSLRFRASLQGVVVGGITIAGLAVIDLAGLAATLALPVISVVRRDPSGNRVADALCAAPLHDRNERLDTLHRTPPARAMSGGPYFSCAGIEAERAEAWLRATRQKSDFPEALRLAHLIAGAVATGQSRGRA
jgi:endonuclease V-like protein UPF0215 family